MKAYQRHNSTDGDETDSISGDDETTSEQKQRRRRRRGILNQNFWSGIVLILMAVLAVLLFWIARHVRFNKQSPKFLRNTSSPTSAPTPVTQFLRLQNFLYDRTGSPEIWDSNSSQYQAIEFLASETSSNVTASTLYYYGGDFKELMERYTMVLLFYETNGDSEWRESFGFLSEGLSVCDWNNDLYGKTRGVVCHPDGTVRSIDLGMLPWSAWFPLQQVDLTRNSTSSYAYRIEANNLIGSLPPEILGLSNLESLYLSTNTLYGTIPSWIAQLPNIREIHLDSNSFRGSIPSDIGLLEGLEYLSLGNNKLTETIPSDFGRLGGLKQLLLNCNRLTGTLPSELSNLSKLVSLELEGNMITGSLPLEYASLPRLGVYQIFELVKGLLLFCIFSFWKSLLETLLIQDNGLADDFSGGICQANILHIHADCSGIEATIQCDCCVCPPKGTSCTIR